MGNTHGEIKARHCQTGEPVSVSWEDGVITRVSSAAAEVPHNLWVAPALFDLQVNGYAGVDFQQDGLTTRDLLHAARMLRRDGCTRFLLTLITDDWTALTARLEHLKSVRSQEPELGSAIAGWHIEGPFLSSEPGFHGAHDPAKMLDPTPERIRKLRKLTGEDPVLLTMAPERRNAIESIRFARSLEMQVSLGHTNASVELLKQAVDAGATAFTHLGNGCHATLDRHDNILWRVFETAGLTVTLIPDGIHVSPPLFRLVHRILPGNSVTYVTDAMSAAGASPGTYSLGKDRFEVGTNRVVRRPGSAYFAGSSLRPVEGMRVAAGMLRTNWQACWQRGAEVSARLMGLRSGLEPGNPAELSLLEEDENQKLTVVQTISRACN